MNRSIISTAVGLLVVLATACGDPTSAEPVDTSPVSEPSAPAPEPTVAPPKPTVPAPEPTVAPPKPTVPAPEPTVAPPKPTLPAPATTVPPPKPTLPPTTLPAPTTPPPTLPPPQPNAAECLVGDWIVTDGELHAYFDVVAGNASFQSIDGTGVIRLTITDTAFTWTNDYALTLTIDDVVYESTSSGAFYGAYSATDGVISGMVIRDNRTGTVTQGGEPVGDVGDLFVGINPARPMDSMAFSCDGPTLMIEAGPRAGARHGVKLTPA